MRMSKYPYVSVVIPTYRRPKDLEHCLRSVLEQSYPKNRYEIVVVTDGYDEKTELCVKKIKKICGCGLRHYSIEHVGCAGSRAFGNEKAKGGIICTTDDDCLVDRDWIKNSVKCFTDERIGWVGGRIVAFSTMRIAEWYAETSGILDQKKFFEPVVTANSTFRKSAIIKAGNFDPEFERTNDVETAIRVKLNGYRFVYSPGSVVFHKHRPTLKKLLRQQFNYGGGHARLHKRYLRDFNPVDLMALKMVRIAFRVATYPFVIYKSFSVRDRKRYLARSILEILVSSAHLLGVFIETAFGGSYSGQKYNKKLEFFRETTTTTRVFGKIRRFL